MRADIGRLACRTGRAARRAGGLARGREAELNVRYLEARTKRPDMAKFCEWWKAGIGRYTRMECRVRTLG